MSPEGLVLLESGARVSSALVVGVFLVLAVRAILQTTDRRRSEVQEQIDRLRGIVEDVGWQMDRLHEQQVDRLLSLEQRVDFTEQLLRRPASSMEARH